jgi:hypothetical protein
MSGTSGAAPRENKKREHNNETECKMCRGTGNAHLQIEVLMAEQQARVERNFWVALMVKKFDEAWYLSKYPDVKEAVKRGAVPSGRQHYVQFGYYENRLPSAIVVNEKWYLETYPDVSEAIRAGIYKSGQAHFEQAGFREGRMPHATFQL